jgi:uncharacterized protein YcbK (DUF882 family)
MSEWNSPHFDRSEFACGCGCGFDTVDAELLNCLEYIREHFDRPVIINSAARCPDHNLACGSNSGSQHLLGRAADIRVDGIEPTLVHELCEQMEVGGLGEYDTFTHLDTRVGFARW